jgi:mycothiol synthase
MTQVNQRPAPTVPAGYRVRPTTLDDADAVDQLYAISYRPKNLPHRPNADELRTDWQSPRFDLSTSSIMIEHDSQLIAIATIWDTSETPVRPWLSWVLHPDYYETAIAQYVIDWLEYTAQRVFDRCPADAKIAFETGVLLGYQPREALITANGYQHVRTFQRMVVRHDAPPPAVQMPAGFSLRPLRYPDELPDYVHAFRDSFQDHYGYVDQAFANELESWRHWLDHEPDFNPQTFYLAIDDQTGAIVAFCFAVDEQKTDADYAYVHELGTCRAYRKRGLASTLLRHAFHDLYQRGRPNVALHVDADSITGATRLYQRVGMRPDQAFGDHEKIMRDGRELANTGTEA